jgi:hypothetical protein
VSDAEAQPERKEACEVGGHRVVACWHERAGITRCWQSK